MFPSTETVHPSKVHFAYFTLLAMGQLTVFNLKNIPMFLVKQQASCAVLGMPSQDRQCACAAMGFERLWTAAANLAGLEKVENLP